MIMAHLICQLGTVHRICVKNIQKGHTRFPGNYYKILKDTHRRTSNTSVIIANGIMNNDNNSSKNVHNSENINDNIIKESAKAKGQPAVLITVAHPFKGMSK